MKLFFSCIRKNRRFIRCDKKIIFFSSRNATFPEDFFQAEHDTVGRICLRRQDF